MLGQEVTRAAPAWARVVPLTRADADLSSAEQARATLTAAMPDVIIHCAAFTDVDGATRDPAAAWRGNAVATRHVAQVAEELGSRLLHISTDYVFDGSGTTPYTEAAAPRPLNAYGASKLAAEREATRAAGWLVVRTQWLFGAGGRNFICAVLEAARAGRPLRVVHDEWGSPTYAPDLAAALWRLLETPATDIVHLTNAGVCSRLELARHALQQAGLGHVEVTGIPASEWPSPTRRPRNAVLASARVQALGIHPLRDWRAAVSDYVGALRERWDEGKAGSER